MTIQKTVLIAEDDSAIMAALKKKCDGLGVRVVTCADGAACISLVQQEKVDCMLVDLVMPEKSGFDVLAAMKGTPNEATPAFVLTNLGGQDDAIKAKELGADEYFIKSQTPLKDVIARVKEELGI